MSGRKVFREETQPQDRGWDAHVPFNFWAYVHRPFGRGVCQGVVFRCGGRPGGLIAGSRLTLWQSEAVASCPHVRARQRLAQQVKTGSPISSGVYVLSAVGFGARVAPWQRGHAFAHPHDDGAGPPLPALRTRL